MEFQSKSWALCGGPSQRFEVSKDETVPEKRPSKCLESFKDLPRYNL